MDTRELKEELTKIYNEMSEWSGINASLHGPVPEDEVRRRELILWSQQILYNIEDAKENKLKDKEVFNTAVYWIVKSFTERGLLQSEQNGNP